jgi:hypothetical protein
MQQSQCGLHAECSQAGGLLPSLETGKILASFGVGAVVYLNMSWQQVLGDECSHGKPHPEPYLQGLKLLQAHADDTIAFEDSPAGARND